MDVVLLMQNQVEFIWIGVVFVNHRIRAKVFLDEPFDRIVQRVIFLVINAIQLTFVLGIEKEYVLGLEAMDDVQKKQQKQKEEDKKGAKRSKSRHHEEVDSAEEEGQIVIPKTVIQRASDLKSEQFYLVVYIRHKTDEELLAEQQQHQEDLGHIGDTGGMSNRFSPRKQQMKIFQNMNININDCYQKAKRNKGEARSLLCPFLNCHKEFTETGNLKTHLRTHTGERPFVCGFEGCSKQFITKGHLKTHELIHSGDKPFQCDKCNKSYSRSGRLKIHQRTHTGEKPFKCPMPNCDKQFTEKGNLKTHLRIHSGEKPFMCAHPGCSKTFTTQGHLTDHMRRHSGERPFKCEHCNQAFMRSSTLKIHMRRHTGEKPYSCNLCGKKFSESGNLKTHIRTHETGIPKKKVLNVVKRNRAILARQETQKQLLLQQQQQQQLKQQEQQQQQKDTKVSILQKQPALLGSLGKRARAEHHEHKDQQQNSAQQHQSAKPEVSEPKKLASLLIKESIQKEIQKKRTMKQLEKQAKMKNESGNGNEGQLIDAQRIMFPLDSGFKQQQNDMNMYPPAERPDYSTPSLSQLPKLKSGQNLFQMGVQNMMGSPQGFAQFNGMNQALYFPTSLGGYQINPNQANNYQRSAIQSKQASFQNLFASLQSGQNIQQLQQNQEMNLSSPTTKPGQTFIYNNMSPGAYNENYGGNTYSNYSPESNKLKGIQQQFQLSQNNTLQSSMQNSLAAKAGIEKWKNMGSFSSITSLNEMIMNQKTLPGVGNGYGWAGYDNGMRPISKQNSANNLLPLSLKNVSQLQQQAEKFQQKIDSLQSLEQTANFAGIQDPDSNTIRQLQKSHSLSNLFTNKALFQRLQEQEQLNSIQMSQQNANEQYAKADEENFSAMATKFKQQQ